MLGIGGEVVEMDLLLGRLKEEIDERKMIAREEKERMNEADGRKRQAVEALVKKATEWEDRLNLDHDVVAVKADRKKCRILNQVQRFEGEL